MAGIVLNLGDPRDDLTEGRAYGMEMVGLSTDSIADLELWGIGAHPIGASNARILGSLVHSLEARDMLQHFETNSILIGSCADPAGIGGEASRLGSQFIARDMDRNLDLLSRAEKITAPFSSPLGIKFGNGEPPVFRSTSMCLVSVSMSWYAPYWQMIV